MTEEPDIDGQELEVDGKPFEGGEYHIWELRQALYDAWVDGATHVYFDAGHNNIVTTLSYKKPEEKIP